MVKTYSGYPGVPGNPNDQPKPKTESGELLGQDAVNSLIRTDNGDVILVSNSKVKK